MSALWYLSFAGDEGWRGAAYVEASSLEHAARRAHELGCNPGGEVFGGEVPDDVEVPDAYRNRVLSLEDLREHARAIGRSDELVRGTADELLEQTRCT